MEHHIWGDYVITPIKNAFNNKTSFWISKRNYTFAVYCFTADTKEEIKEQLDNVDAYIKLYENTLLNWKENSLQ